LENVYELKSNIVKYSEEVDHPTLAEFLEEIALYTDLDSWDESSDYVIMMTLHSAKGLEFDTVFLWDPTKMKYPCNDANVKLLYVAATRALHQLVVAAEGELSEILME